MAWRAVRVRLGLSFTRACRLGTGMQRRQQPAQPVDQRYGNMEYAWLARNGTIGRVTVYHYACWTRVPIGTYSVLGGTRVVT